MNLASGVAVYKAREIQIYKKIFPANVSAHPTQPGAREEWQGSAPPLPRHRLYTKRQGGGKEGGGGGPKPLKILFWLHPCINRVNKFNLPPQKYETVTQKAGHEPVEPSEPFKGTPPWEGALHNVLYR